MSVYINSLTPNFRELPVLSFKLGNKNLNGKATRVILNPNKFEDVVPNPEINIKEIKALLLMMVKGNSNFITQLIKSNRGNYINLVA